MHTPSTCARQRFDLVVRYNNYLLASSRSVRPLYWNADSTRMPAAMHSFYLRKMYRKLLVQRRHHLGRVPIDLFKIKPSLSAVDSRGPYRAVRSTYAATRSMPPGQVRAVGLGPHRRRRQPRAASTAITRTTPIRDRRRMARRRTGTPILWPSGRNGCQICRRRSPGRHPATANSPRSRTRPARM